MLNTLTKESGNRPLSARFSNPGPRLHTAREIVLGRATKPHFPPQHPSPDYALISLSCPLSVPDRKSSLEKGGAFQASRNARALFASYSSRGNRRSSPAVRYPSFIAKGGRLLCSDFNQRSRTLLTNATFNPVSFAISSGIIHLSSPQRILSSFS